MADDQEQKPSLAFTFQKKKVVQKVAVNVQERKDTGQLISGFDGAKAQVVGGDSAGDSKQYVIPKLENTFKTGVGPKKFTPTFKPPSDQTGEMKPGDDKFVQAESTVPVITEYGLQLRDVKAEDRAKAAAAANGSGNRNAAVAALEERAYKEAVEELPDVADEEAYEAMPVEEFGRAMLRGMGWEDGMGVGRNRRKVDAIEYVRRPERLGLGAQPVKLGEDPNKIVKMGDKPRKQDLVLAPDADGRQRNIRTLDEKLVPRSAVLPGPQPGKQMRITAGPHAGLACTALEVLAAKAEGRPERWRVRLIASDEEVDVLASELGERWEKEQQQPKGAARGDSAGPRDSDRERSADRERERGRGREGSGAPDRGMGGRGGGEAKEPSSRRGGSADADGAPLGRQGDPRDREGDPGRERGREREQSGYDDDDGRAGKRRHGRDGDDREQDDARAGKRTHGSDRDQDRDREHDDRRRRDGGGEDEDERRHSKKHKHEKKHKHDKREKKAKKNKERHKHSSESEDDEDGGGDDGGGRRAGPTWLLPHIKVRIVDRHVRSGKLYLKKGTIVDVHPGGTADVAVDDTGDVLRLAEDSLETVVPKHQGAPVLVVAGPHRGARGRLLQANTSAGAAAVQLAADFTIVRLLLDDVAGFAGELEDE